MRGREKSAKAPAKSAISGVKKMDERMKELVAMGAAGAMLYER
jgi:hypothetical protein